MTNFDKWVRDMYLRCSSECLKDRCEVSYLSNDDITLVYDKKKNKVGIAKRHPKDKIDRELGVAIAYARCKGYDVPKKPVYKKLSEMKNGDRFIYRKETVLHFIGKYPFLKDMYVMLNNSGTTYVLADEEFEMVD